MPRPRTGPRDRRFPETFVFGVATSDHQCEAYDPAHEDIRDVWERATGRTPRGRATDFWTRYPEDVALAAGLGCKAFRFSVSWTRVEPEPGRYDPAVLDHYLDVAKCIEQHGMRSIVTLHHFTWPPYLEAEGGMLGESFPDHFAAYAEAVAKRLAPHVGWWITFNEPTFLPLGYIKFPWERDYLMPPGLGGASTAEQIDAASTLIRNLFVAHTHARRRIRAVAADSKVGVNPFVLGMPAFLQKFLDRLASRPADSADWRRRQHGHVGTSDGTAGGLDVVMGALSWTPDRERDVMFSEPYASSRPVILVPSGSPVREASDVGGARIAALRGSNTASLLRALPRPPELTLVRSLDRAVDLARAGEVDGLASDDALLVDLAAMGATWRQVPLSVHRAWYCAGVAPRHEGLLREVDAAIHEVIGHDGLGAPAPFDAMAGTRPRRLVTVGASRAFYTPHPAPATRPHARFSRGIEKIRSRGTLVVGVRRGVSPFSRFDATSQRWSGLEIDIARALAHRILGDPERVRFVELDANERVRRLQSLRSRLAYSLSRWRALFSTITNTNWWYLGMAGKLPEFLCPPECVDQLDFVGFDYYWGVPEVRWDRVMRLLDSLGGRYSRAPVYPGGLSRLLRRYRRMFPGKDLLVIENGSVDRADGVTRADYLHAHLREVQNAVAKGTPVKAYVCWSITTNREWGLPLGADSDFGLYHIDLDHDPELKRIRTPAADTYAAIIASRDCRGVPDMGTFRALKRLVRKAKRRLRRSPK